MNTVEELKKHTEQEQKYSKKLLAMLKKSNNKLAKGISQLKQEAK